MLFARAHVALFAALALTSCGGGSDRDAGADGTTTSDLGTDSPAPVDLGMDAPAPDVGPPCTDADSDGHGAMSCGGDDCDDTDATRYPGNPEVCDALGHDEDCDPSTLGPDMDGDGTPYVGCCNTQPGGALLCGTDCDDTRRTVGPTAIESCDGVDDNCNGMIDEGVQSTYCLDGDGDGHGSLSAAMSGCGMPMGTTTICNDCDDFATSTYPGQIETCDGYDDNCNYAVDEGCACPFDGDVQGCGLATGACIPGTQTCIGGVWEATCAGATLPTLEVCNGIDDDCDFEVDEGVTFTFYPDCDGDGFGVDARSVVRCTQPTGVPPGCPRGVWTSRGGDCDDTDATRYPGTGCGLDAGVDLGVDSGTPPPMPTMIDDAVGDGVICALFSDHTVGCQGANDVGQHGDGTARVLAPFTPVYGTFVTGLADAVEVTFGGGLGATGHGCARRMDHTVVCWGSSSHGELGYGGYGVRTTFVGVPGITDATQLAAGYQHTCVLHTDHTVSCFGAGSSGQLGNGHTDDAAVPDVVFGLTDAAQIAAGDYHTCALRTTGDVVCWGNDFYGQLGDGGTTNQSMPVAVSLSGPAMQVAAGSTSTCALLTTGGIECWGANTHGQIGTGATTPAVEPAPRAVTMLHGTANEIAVGRFHACAHFTDDVVQCWGANDVGELGLMFTGPDQPTPQMTNLPTGRPYGHLHAGGADGCIDDTAAGALWCWGGNEGGEVDGFFGSGSGTSFPSPIAITIGMPL